MVGAIEDPQKKAAAANALMDSVETHYKKLNAARQIDKSDSAKKERNAIRRALDNLGKQMAKGLGIEDPAFLERVAGLKNIAPSQVA